MSYILDALKKLEHEKNRKARGSGVVNIAGTLLSDDRPAPAGTGGLRVALIVAAAVLVTSATTWLFLRPLKVSEKPAARTIAPAVPAPAAPPVAPVSPATAASPASVAPAPPPSVAVPVQAQKAPQTVRADAHPAPAQPAPAAKVPEAAPVNVPSEDAAALITAKELRSRMKERKGASPSPDQMVAAPADIKLSGIAWQDERRSRRAVINGFLMQEGGLVSGAKIIDIFQDRVRFSAAGKYFEIPLLSSPAPAGK